MVEDGTQNDRLHDLIWYCIISWSSIYWLHADVARFDSKGKRRWPWCNRNVHILEPAWAPSWPGVNIYILVQRNKFSSLTFVLIYDFWFLQWQSVPFLRKPELRKVFQASSKSWTVCRSANWSLRLCWMELWVNLFTHTCVNVSQLYIYIYEQYTWFCYRSPEVSLCGCITCQEFN